MPVYVERRRRYRCRRTRRQRSRRWRYRRWRTRRQRTRHRRTRRQRPRWRRWYRRPRMRRRLGPHGPLFHPRGNEHGRSRRRPCSRATSLDSTPATRPSSHNSYRIFRNPPVTHPPQKNPRLRSGLSPASSRQIMWPAHEHAEAKPEHLAQPPAEDGPPPSLASAHGNGSNGSLSRARTKSPRAAECDSSHSPTLDRSSSPCLNDVL